MKKRWKKRKKKKKQAGLSSLALTASAPDHLGSGDVTALVHEIEIALGLFHTDFGYHLLFAARFLSSASHLGSGDVSFLINKVEIPSGSLYSYFCNFLCH